MYVCNHITGVKITNLNCTLLLFRGGSCATAAGAVFWSAAKRLLACASELQKGHELSAQQLKMPRGLVNRWRCGNEPACVCCPDLGAAGATCALSTPCGSCCCSCCSTAGRMVCSMPWPSPSSSCRGSAKPISAWCRGAGPSAPPWWAPRHRPHRPYFCLLPRGPGAGR